VKLKHHLKVSISVLLLALSIITYVAQEGNDSDDSTDEIELEDSKEEVAIHVFQYDLVVIDNLLRLVG
jgi:hypothetical protein